MKKYIDSICDYCKKEYKMYIRKYNRNIKDGTKKQFCSTECANKGKCTSVKKQCKNCNKEITVVLSDLKQNNFCCQSCAATYNNKHKTHGYRRSKLETWIETKISAEYPNLKVEYNCKTAINSELDIYIPSLNLAFELNGIFHYEPIYGAEKYMSILFNDKMKFKECQEKNISLCIIDTSKVKYCIEKNYLQFWDIINKIINENIIYYTLTNNKPL